MVRIRVCMGKEMQGPKSLYEKNELPVTHSSRTPTPDSNSEERQHSLRLQHYSHKVFTKHRKTPNRLHHLARSPQHHEYLTILSNPHRQNEEVRPPQNYPPLPNRPFYSTNIFLGRSLHRRRPFIHRQPPLRLSNIMGPSLHR